LKSQHKLYEIIVLIRGSSTCLCCDFKARFYFTTMMTLILLFDKTVMVNYS